MLGLASLPEDSIHSVAPCATPGCHLEGLPLGGSSSGSAGSKVVPAAPLSRSTASSCGESVAVDSSDKDCELSEKVGDSGREVSKLGR